MTRREAERQTRQMDTLRALGFSRDEAESLRRISMTLQRWYEKECGNGYGCIERDEKTGKPYWLNANNGQRSPIADRENGALRRLIAMIDQRDNKCPENKDIRPGYPLGTHSDEYFDVGKCLYCGRLKVTHYIQGDPRGAALYIIRPGDIPEGATVDNCYSRGICVY